MILCAICLRTDRDLKTIASYLTVHHDEITNYKLTFENPKYCYECEWLLRKNYKFHRRCEAAEKILNEWIKLKKKDRLSSVEGLHLKLPTHTLSDWIPNNSKIFTFIEADVPDMPCFAQVSVVDNSNISEVEGENRKKINSKTSSKTDIQNNDNSNTTISKNIHTAKNESNVNNILQNKETNDNIKSDITVVDYNKQQNFKQDITSSDQGNNTNNSTKARQNTDATNVKSGNENETITIENCSTEQRHKTFEKPDSEKQPTHKISQITNDAETNTTQLTDEITQPTNDNSVKVNSDIHKINTNDTEDKDEIICIDEDQNNCNNDVIVIDDEDFQFPDDASLNSDDDCDDYLHAPPKKRKKKMTLGELANISLSEEDFDSDDEFLIDKAKKKLEDTNVKDISNERDIEAKLEAVNDDLNRVCENWEVTLLADLDTKDLKLDVIRKITQQYLREKIKPSDKTEKTSNKVKDYKITGIIDDLEKITKESLNIVEDFKMGSSARKKRLNAELVKMLESWDELKTEQGYKFDKALIINSIDKVAELNIKQLMGYLKGAKIIRPGAARILKIIEKKQLLSKYESGFDVEYLTTQQEILDEFERRKTYPCYVEANYKCEICYQGFDKAGHLENHKKLHSAARGEFSCSICQVRHRSYEKLKSHLYGLHSAVYKCKMCPLVTYYRLSIVNHYEQHMGVQYKCEYCINTFKSKSMYLTHQSKEHPRGTHVCTICGRSYISDLGLKRHQVLKHRGENPDPSVERVNCESCDLTFPSQEALNVHTRMTHRAANTRFPKGYGGQLRFHRLGGKRKKGAPPVLSCRVCNESGVAYGWLAGHFATQHPTLDITQVYADRRVYLCDICGKGFMIKSNFQDHMDIHNGVTHQCPECQQMCATRGALYRHRLRHGPPSYACDQCGKKFHSRANLCNHMRTHIDRPYKCHMCEKCFIYRYSLIAHIQGVHYHVRPVKKTKGSKRRGTDLSFSTDRDVAQDTSDIGVEMSDA